MNAESLIQSYEVYAGVNRPEMLKYIPADAKSILDVGCSVGNFGEFIKKSRRAEVWGVEISEEAASIASDKLDKVICDSFGSHLDMNKKFDCVIFNDVLEHMVDPYSALRYTKEILSDGGTVVASIPNVRYFTNIWQLLIHRDWTYTEAGILDRTHLRFFTKNSIASTFRDQGYVVETIAGINPLDACDPGYRTRFHFANLITLGQISDMRWLQYAVVARPQI